MSADIQNATPLYISGGNLMNGHGKRIINHLAVVRNDLDHVILCLRQDAGPGGGSGGRAQQRTGGDTENVDVGGAGWYV